jgi:hypothetical protein
VDDPSVYVAFPSSKRPGTALCRLDDDPVDLAVERLRRRARELHYAVVDGGPIAS